MVEWNSWWIKKEDKAISTVKCELDEKSRKYLGYKYFGEDYYPDWTDYENVKVIKRFKFWDLILNYFRSWITLLDRYLKNVSIYREVFKMEDQKMKAISEIVKIIEQCRYDDELSEGYKREILDQEKVYD